VSAAPRDLEEADARTWLLRAVEQGGRQVSGPIAENDARLRATNRRTALTLLAIALLFFFGIIASRFIESPVVSITVVGGAVLLYLIVAIGRHLRK
jgi:hypothetical protein